jgi:hypothetical protein
MPSFSKSKNSFQRRRWMQHLRALRFVAMSTPSKKNSGEQIYPGKMPGNILFDPDDWPVHPDGHGGYKIFNNESFY